MISKEDSDKLCVTIYSNASLKRVLGMIFAYLEGKKNCTLNWITGQITKAHSLEEAEVVLAAFHDEFTKTNVEKFQMLKTKLSL